MKKKVGLFATIAVVAALAQTPPAFEVASVKPRKNGDGFNAFGCSPNGRFVSGGPLREVLLWAFAIKPYQLVGLPDWDPRMMRDTTGLYAIEGRASGPVTEDVCMFMVQSLLRDRFKMAVHHESREMPVYALVVGKKGLKTRKASDSDTTPGINVKVMGNPLGVPAGTPKDYKPPTGWSMANLADFLGIAQLGRPVIDRTGLEGLYRISLDFSISFPQQPDFVPPQGFGPDIKTALEEQMGLTLESAKAPIEMLIIDHIEKPDAN
jgi:uncharacterized protein (TIGR03435 family)